MAYTLKATGLATKLTHCFAVDDDGSVKDFVSGSAVTLSWVDGTDGAVSGVTGAAQWRSATSNGSSHKYFTTTSSRFIKFGAGNLPTFALGSTRTIFVALANVARDVNQNSCVTSTNSGNWVGIESYDNWRMNFATGSCNARSSYATDVDNTYVGASLSGQYSFAVASNGATGVYMYLNATDRTESAVATATLRTMQPGYIGKRDATNATYLAADYFLVAQFNDYLTSTDIAALNTDWFGELFEASGASAVAPIVMKWRM